MESIFETYDWENVTIEDLIKFVTGKTEIRCSELQSRFLWGYNRAGRVMDWLIEKKIVEDDGIHVHRKVLLTYEAAIVLAVEESGNKISNDK
jgi:hypothetical protein